MNTNRETYMRIALAPLRTASVFGLLCVLFAVPATAQDRPLLSAEIRTVLEEDGLEAAQQRFEELYPEQQDQYEPDTNGLFEIASGYMQAGDMETGQALMEMATVVMSGAAAAYTESMYGDMAAMEAAAASASAAEQQAARAAETQPSVEYDPGPSRTDLDRFAGLYSDPAAPDEQKSFFVAVGCDGRLVTGAMWADVSPWWMTSVSDLVFEYEGSWTQIRMEFEAGSEGLASGMTHDRDDILPSPLTRIGPLPPEWRTEECIQPPEVCRTC